MFAQAHGTVPGGSFAVLAMGKLGSREMTATSDIDLILLYDAPSPTELSTGPKPLAAATYFARLSQRLINALTVPTGEGTLFDVDMRLRPSGNAGPIACSLEALRRYHEDSAWTWERMSLTRARVIAGDPEFCPMVRAAVDDILIRPANPRHRDPDLLLRDVADMRRRIAGQHASPAFWDIKQRRGGLIDIEFIAQYLQLCHASLDPTVLAAGTADALRRLADAGFLAPQTAADLLNALLLWHRVQGLLRLTVDGLPTETSFGPGLRKALAQGAGAVDFNALQSDIDTVARQAMAHYAALVDLPAAQLPPLPTSSEHPAPPGAEQEQAQ
jgi:glutamate-ammonia-ligase adenylyltransferase